MVKFLQSLAVVSESDKHIYIMLRICCARRARLVWPQGLFKVTGLGRLCASQLMPAHQPQQERHVVADGTQRVSDGAEPVEAQQVERHGALPCQHLHPVAFSVAVGVLTQLGVADPVPGILDRPAVPHVLQQRFCGGAQTREVVAGLLDRSSLTRADGPHRNDQGAARPDLLDRRGGFHCPQGPGAGATVAAFGHSGLKWLPLAVGQAIADQLKSLSPTAFDGNQEVGALLRKEEKNGRFP